MGWELVLLVSLGYLRIGWGGWCYDCKASSTVPTAGISLAKDFVTDSMLPRPFLWGVAMPSVSFPSVLIWQIIRHCCLCCDDFQDCWLADAEFPVLLEPGYQGPFCTKFVGLDSGICNGLSPWMKRRVSVASALVWAWLPSRLLTGSSAKVSAKVRKS